MSVRHRVDVFNSLLVSSIRAWRGTMAFRDVGAPAQLLHLYDVESNADCREIREILTELNLDALIIPCPDNGHHTAELYAVAAMQGCVSTPELPVLVDPNQGDQAPALIGREAVKNYLLAMYGRDSVPRILPTQAYEWWNAGTGWLASKLRGESVAYAAKPAAQPLRLYSFESSPFSRLVRERLCELQVKYELRNMGKEQISDFGPNGARWSWKEWRPVAGGRREQMIAAFGRAQMPYLEDPNTGAKLFESKSILNYLEKTYADG